MKSLFKNRLLRSWAFYDFSNSSYVLIFQSFLLPVFFSTMLQGELGFSKFSWGLANGLSTLFGLILAVLGGTYSDKTERLKVFKWFILLTFLFIAIFSFSVNSFIGLSFYLYIICNSFFITTISLSDSLLKFISPQNKINEYSGFAWGWGYIGGILCLLVVMFVQSYTSEFSVFTFLSVALFYLFFSIIAWNGIKKNSINLDFNPVKQLPKVGESNSLSTKNKFLLLLGYWLISESITVIILFYSIYASEELELSTKTIGITLLAVQFIGFFATWYGGKLADRFGTIKLLGISVLIWVIVILLLVFVTNIYGLAGIVILTGLVIGNSQSFLRAQYTNFVQKHNIGFQFSLFAISTQAAVIIGPILHGYLTDKFDSQKIPLSLLIIFLIVGFFLIRIVNRNMEIRHMKTRYSSVSRSKRI